MHVEPLEKSFGFFSDLVGLEIFVFCGFFPKSKECRKWCSVFFFHYHTKKPTSANVASTVSLPSETGIFVLNKDSLQDKCLFWTKEP